jgi:hypothetical protein
LIGLGAPAAPFGFGAAVVATLPAGTTTFWSVLPTTIGIVVSS